MEGIRLLAETTGIFTETAGRSHDRRPREWRRGDIGAARSRGACNTGDGLKTLDEVRDVARPTRWSRRLASLGRTSLWQREGACPWRVECQDPAQLRALTGNESETTVEAGSVGEALDAVYARYEGLRDRITENGELRRFVNVYVGGEDIRFGQAWTPRSVTATRSRSCPPSPVGDVVAVSRSETVTARISRTRRESGCWLAWVSRATSIPGARSSIARASRAMPNSRTCARCT